MNATRLLRRARLACLILLPLAACRPSAAPVASVAVSPEQISLAYPAFLDVELAFDPRVERDALGLAPTVFVHLLDEPGNVLRTFDHPLPEGWRPGGRLTYPIRLLQSALAEPLPPGAYVLSAGVYDADSGRRFPLQARGRELGAQEYALATVRVPEPTGALPRFEFSSGWLPAEAGTDRQVLASRWMSASEGSLRAAGLAPGSRLQLVLRVPSGNEPGMHFERVPGNQGPVVELQTNCSPERLVLAGEGAHPLELTVPDTGSAAGCEVRLSCNYLLVGERVAVSYSVRLESLAWQGPRIRR